VNTLQWIFPFNFTVENLFVIGSFFYNINQKDEDT